MNGVSILTTETTVSNSQQAMGRKRLDTLSVAAPGVAFGDIGTSPFYSPTPWHAKK